MISESGRAADDGIVAFLVAAGLGEFIIEAKLAEFFDRIGKLIHSQNLNNAVDIRTRLPQPDQKSPSCFMVRRIRDKASGV